MGRKGKKPRVSREEEEEIESEVEGEHQENMNQSSANEKSLYEVFEHLYFVSLSYLVSLFVLHAFNDVSGLNLKWD